MLGVAERESVCATGKNQSVWACQWQESADMVDDHNCRCGRSCHSRVYGDCFYVGGAPKTFLLHCGSETRPNKQTKPKHFLRRRTWLSPMKDKVKPRFREWKEKNTTYVLSFLESICNTPIQSCFSPLPPVFPQWQPCNVGHAKSLWWAHYGTLYHTE